MVHKKEKQPLVIMSQLRIPLVVGFLVTLIVSGQNIVAQQDVKTPAEREVQRGFVTMNTQQKDEYRDECYKNILSELNQTSFAAAHQELLAQALSKMYVGIPVCAYTYSYETQGELFKEVDVVGDLGMDGRWSVLPRGIQDYISELPEGWQFRRKPLYPPTSPFVYIPAIPFSFSDGTVSKEASTTAAFSFPLDNLLFVHSHRRVEWLAKQADWNIELTIDKDGQAPKALNFLLAEPVKNPMRYSFDVVEISMKYTFVENCEFHALTSLTVRIEGSALTRGKFVEEKSDSYTDIECEQPLVYLHPNTPRVTFLDHILW